MGLLVCVCGNAEEGDFLQLRNLIERIGGATGEPEKALLHTHTHRP